MHHCFLKERHGINHCIIFQPMKTTPYCVLCLTVKVTWQLQNKMEILPSSVKIHLNCTPWNKAVFWMSCYYMSAWKTRNCHRSSSSCFSFMRQTWKTSWNLNMSKKLVLDEIKFFKINVFYKTEKYSEDFLIFWW